MFLRWSYANSKHSHFDVCQSIGWFNLEAENASAHMPMNYKYIVYQDILTVFSYGRSISQRRPPYSSHIAFLCTLFVHLSVIKISEHYKGNVVIRISNWPVYAVFLLAHATPDTTQNAIHRHMAARRRNLFSHWGCKIKIANLFMFFLRFFVSCS